MRIYPKTWIVAIMGIAAFFAFVMFGPRSRDLSARANATETATPAKAAPAHEYTPIAPADVLGTGTPWAPATGDGSN